MSEDRIASTFAEIADNFTRLRSQSALVSRAASLIVESLRAGGKVLFCGNGGSAADAQHLAAELIGRFLRDRAPLPALALTVDTSALTAIGNDFGYEHVFERQLAGIGRKGDVLVAISTSGNSRNVLRAAETAKALGIAVIAMTGAGGGALGQMADLAIRVPATRTDHIQEMHIAIGHLLCGLAEEALCA